MRIHNMKNGNGKDFRRPLKVRDFRLINTHLFELVSTEECEMRWQQLAQFWPLKHHQSESEDRWKDICHASQKTPWMCSCHAHVPQIPRGGQASPHESSILSSFLPQSPDMTKISWKKYLDTSQAWAPALKPTMVVLTAATGALN